MSIANLRTNLRENNSRSSFPRLSTDLFRSSTPNLNSSVSSLALDSVSRAGTPENLKPPANRISRRSISRHPPSGTAESAVDVLTILDTILKTSDLEDDLNDEDTTISEKPPSECDDEDDDLSFLDSILESRSPSDTYSPPFISLKDLEDTNSPQEITLEHNEYDDEIILRNYQEKLNQFDDIRSQIQHSDTILGDIETYLTSFQKDLNTLSAEMESLETRSRALNRKLIIRQNAEQKLAPVVEALIIPPMIVQQISDGEISMQWLAALKYINQRQNELAIMLKERQEFKAIKAAEQQLQIVSRKALERIRNFMASRIKSFRNFGVNSQIVQKELLDYRDLYSYLKTQCPELAEDILQAYINTMAWYYISYFQRYIKALEKMNIHKVERNVLLGSDEGGKRGLIFSRSSAKEKTSMQVIMDSMNLGNRGNIITSDDPSVILAQIAETSANAPTIYHMETGFRSLNLALLDNVTIEYQFLQDFFQLKPGDQVNKVFDTIFEKTFALGQEYTKFLTQDSFDSYGILICIRLCRKLEFESQHRRIPVMGNYLNLQLINLWPRFQSVMDAHCESLHRASSRSTLHSFVAETTGAAGTGGIGSSAAALVPHPLTQAFSSFVAGILALCENEDSTSEPVARSLVRLRNEFESVLTKLSAAAFGSESSNSKSAGSKREKFLYNNYFLVSTILSDLTGPLADQENEHFKMLTEAYEPESERKKKENVK